MEMCNMFTIYSPLTPFLICPYARKAQPLPYFEADCNRSCLPTLIWQFWVNKIIFSPKLGSPNLIYQYYFTELWDTLINYLNLNLFRLKKVAEKSWGCLTFVPWMSGPNRGSSQAPFDQVQSRSFDKLPQHTWLLHWEWHQHFPAKELKIKNEGLETKNQNMK